MSSSKENLTEREAAAYLRTTSRTLRNLRRKGGGPAFARVGRTIIYRLVDLQKWQAVQSTRTQRAPVQEGAVMSSLDTAVINDAREGTYENEDVPRASHLEIHVSHAESIKSSEWQLATGPWSDFVALLLDHQEQDTKDGRAFLPGLLRGQRRINAEVELLNLMVYDLDRGECLASVRQKVMQLRVRGSPPFDPLAPYHLFRDRAPCLPDLLAKERGIRPRCAIPIRSQAPSRHVLEDLHVVSVNESCGTDRGPP